MYGMSVPFATGGRRIGKGRDETHCPRWRSRPRSSQLIRVLCRHDAAGSVSDATSTRLRTLAEGKIRTAFPLTPPPSTAEMRNDHCPECRETVARFAGKAWPALQVDDLRGNPAPSLLTPSGFRYYLPAMMLCSMQAPIELDCFPDSVISMLSPPRGRSTGAHADYIAGFTVEQAGAILAFLRFLEQLEREDWEAGSLAPESLLTMSTFKVLARALEYWAQRAQTPTGANGAA